MSLQLKLDAKYARHWFGKREGGPSAHLRNRFGALTRLPYKTAFVGRRPTNAK